MKFSIYAGLSGGFGGAQFQEVFEGSLEQAEQRAYESACEEYESYDGMHGLMSVEDFIVEEGLDAEEAYEAWKEEREGWVEYYIKPYTEGDEL